jgi:hypothetical protein
MCSHPALNSPRFGRLHADDAQGRIVRPPSKIPRHSRHHHFQQSVASRCRTWYPQIPGPRPHLRSIRCRSRTQRRSADSARGRAEQFRPEHSPKPCPAFIITPSTSLSQLDVCVERVDYPQDVESPVPGQAQAQGSQLNCSRGAPNSLAPPGSPGRCSRVHVASVSQSELARRQSALRIGPHLRMMVGP